MSRPRLEIYVPLVQQFSARVVFLHSKVAEVLGIHATDLKALRILGDQSMTSSALGEAIGLGGPAVTALVDRLESGGFVQRQRSATDRRQVFVRAVPERMEEIDRLYASHSERMGDLLDRYTEAEFAAITHFLEQTTEILKQESSTLNDYPLVTIAATLRVKKN